MTIKTIRILEIIILSIILITKSYFLLAYNGVMYLFIEILNSKIVYLNHKNYKITNALFIGYQLLITINRTRTKKFGKNVEEGINIVEHIFFALIVCLLISQLLLFFKKITLTKRQEALVVFTIFNTIGVFNEFFQNIISNRSLFIFTPDSVKDIGINFIGSLILVVYSLNFKRV
jgi:VanZ family protein